MDILRAAVGKNDKDANTWVATDYWTHYGSKIGTSDLFYREPVHVVLASYLAKYNGPEGDAGKGYFRLQDVGPGGITVREFYGDGTVFCEHRIYLIVKEQ